MKPERAFVAERALARHCPELVRQGRVPSVDPLAALGRDLSRLCGRLSGALAPLLGGPAPEIGYSGPDECDTGALTTEIGLLAANSLLAAGHAAVPVLASIDAGAVLRIVDRAFGGPGQAPAALPEAFPPSALVMIGRIESLIAAALAASLDLAVIAPLRRDGSLARLEPFAEGTPLVLARLVVTQPGHDDWRIVIALPLASLAVLSGEAGQSSQVAAVHRGNPGDEPFGDVPLTLAATVVDMRLPMSVLSGLRPGSLLPVAVARSVPLLAGGRELARGSIGSVDDRLAVQITHAFSMKGTHS